MKEEADQLRAARAAWDEATGWLSGATPLVNSGAIAFPVAEQLADAARKLGDALTPPQTRLDLDSFAARAADLERLATAVRVALAEFSRPLRADALAKLRARAANADAGPLLVAEFDAILATPLCYRGPRWVVGCSRGAHSEVRGNRDSQAQSQQTVNPHEAVAEPARYRVCEATRSGQSRSWPWVA